MFVYPARINCISLQCAVLRTAGECGPCSLLQIHSVGTLHMENLEIVTCLAIEVQIKWCKKLSGIHR
jgi:hypothetical protein